MSKLIKFLFIIGTVVSGLVSVYTVTHFERGSYFIFDFFQKHLSIEHTNDVALIYLDQDSINQMSKSDGFNFPWPREYYGAVNSVAKALDAKLIFFDILFTEASSFGIDDDKNFAALIKSSNVPSFFPAPDGGGTVKPPVEPILNVAAGLGGAHIKSSKDGVYRVVNRELSGNVLSMPYKIADFLKLNPSSGEILRFYSNQMSITPFYNIIKGFRSIMEGRAVGDLEHLRGKIWMVGFSAPGLMDLRPTPIDPKTPGVFVHATALQNIIASDGLKEASWFFLFFFSILFSLLILAVGRVIKEPTETITAMLSFSVLAPIGVSIILWVYFSLWLNPLSLVFSLVLFSVALLSYRFHEEWITQMRIASSLEHAMSGEMLEMVKKGGIDSLQFSEHRTVTILFSDIVDFTNISEGMDADRLAKLLNDYYDEVVELIFDYGGYVDKFIGDAVMAVWGAPMNQNDHAKLAIAAAQKYQNRLKDLNIKLKKEDASNPDVNARVGIHTGEVVAGNIGSSKRFNYTFIGDSVNLASRLEGICKQYKLRLLLSDATVDSANLADHQRLLLVDRITVKGKEKATEIFTLVEDEYHDIRAVYEDAFSLYQSEKFPEALSKFEQCNAFGPSIVMGERCKDIITNGVPINFNRGVWSYDTK